MNYHDRKPPTITGRVERCRPARQGHRHDHVSPAALALAASLRAAGRPAGDDPPRLAIARGFLAVWSDSKSNSICQIATRVRRG